MSYISFKTVYKWRHSSAYWFIISKHVNHVVFLLILVVYGCNYACRLYLYVHACMYVDHICNVYIRVCMNAFIMCLFICIYMKAYMLYVYTTIYILANVIIKTFFPSLPHVSYRPTRTIVKIHYSL
jgi:hypothetical protein